MMELALFPLRTVLFPGGVLPLKIFEQRYLEMTKNCIRDASPFGVCLIRDGAEVGAPAVPHPVGCSARIAEWDMPHLGLFHLVCNGEQIFRIVEHWTQKNGLMRALVELRDPPLPYALPAEYSGLGELLGKIIDKFGEERFPAPVQLDDADWVAWRLTEVLPIELELKQQLLEAHDAVPRLEQLKLFLESRSVVL
jgi:Lon protease-like protein